jgi:hypothetical protein
VAYVKRRDGATLGPAPHTGSELRPGDLVTRINDVKNVGNCVGDSGELTLCTTPPLTLHFKRCWHPVCDNDGDAAHASEGAGDDEWEAETIWIVEKILDSREGDEGWEYLVRWEGYASKYDTWEPEDHILDELLISDYWRHAGKGRSQVPLASAKGEKCSSIEAPLTQSGASIGRPAKRKAKFPAQQPSGAPRRRGKKPCHRRPEELATLEIPPATLDIGERVAACKERLLRQEGREEAAKVAQADADTMTYVA